MDMHVHTGSQETPFNINEPYANNLITIIASIIAFLAVRHLLTRKRSIPFYQRIENCVVNKFSYSFINFPVGAFLLMVALISAVLPLLLLNVDLAVNSNRAGFLGLALVPFILSSVGKNSAMSLVTGISPMRLNFIHRILALTLFVCVTVHMATMIYSWSKFPAFLESELALTKVQHGLAGYGSLCVVLLGSFFLVRKFWYELFVFTHLFAFGFIGAISVHTPYAMRYFVVGLVCYVLNLVAVWCVKSHLGYARFDVLPGGCTKVSIRLVSPMKIHTVGQHINLCIPSIGSVFQWHPFTITSLSRFDDHVEVHVCSRGNFTRKLYNKIDQGEELTVFLNGPFGSARIDPKKILDTHDTVIIALGGSGVTFGARLLREFEAYLLHSDKVHTKNIHVAWSVRQATELEWFLDEFEYYNHTFNTTPNYPSLHFKSYITGVDEFSPNVLEHNIDELREDIGVENLSENTNALVNGEKNPQKKKGDVLYQSRIKPNDYLSLCTGDTGLFGNVKFSDFV